MGWVTKLSIASAGLLVGLVAILPPAIAVGCQNHPWAEQPCPGVKVKWERVLELQDLHASLAAARSFEAFLAGRDEEAAHFLTIARGEGPERSLTTGEPASPKVARVQRRREAGCIADPYASTPCLGTAGAWESYAAEHDLEKSWESSRDFVAKLSDHASAARRSGQSGRDDVADEDGEAPADKAAGGLIIRVYPGVRYEGS